MKSKLVKRAVLHAEARSRAILGIEGKRTFGPFSIVLPSEHALPRNLEEHPLYDRFLPYLAAQLPQGSTVIDVGANCGDTLASMAAANPALRFVCIEPDDVFFSYLERNIERLHAVAPELSVTAIKALVGKEVTKAHMQTRNGTSHSVPSDSEQSKPARTLDEIARESSIKDITLLKSDVDGFDYDVLDSAEQVIREQTPILFFECYQGDDKQRASYKKTLQILQASAYEDWVIFDNFGELILRTRDVGQIEQLFDYCWRQTAGRSTRTINYFDLMCATKRHAALIDGVVAGYISHDFA